MPSYNLSVKSDDPALYAKQIAHMVRDRAELSREESVTLRRNVNRWYDLYRGYVRARSQPFRNQVHLPMLFSAIETGIAIKHGLLTGQKPYVEFLPGGPEDGPAARRTTSLIQQQLEDVDIETKLANIFRQGDITGTCPIQWSWKFLKQARPQRVPAQSAMQGMAPPPDGMNPDIQSALFEIQLVDQVDFDGPWVDVLDVLDWYPAPGFPDIKTMPWCIRRCWMDYDDVLMLVQNGIFDAAAAEELADTQITDETSTEFESRRAAPGGLRWSMPNVIQRDRYSKPVEILEMHGIVPNEFVPEDGFRNRLITVGNGTAVLRNVANPIWANGLPFAVYCPTPDPYSIYGIGKVEPNDKLQATASRLMSQKLDAVDFLIDPMFAYNRDANVQLDKLYAKPGGFVGGSGAPSEWLQPITPDIKGMQQGSVEIEAVWRWLQLGTGITEEAIGMGGGEGSDRQTAREFLGKMENVQKRMVHESLAAARQVLLPIAEAFRAMNSQFLSFPTQVRMQGVSATLDPLTGEEVPPDQSVNLEDVVNRFDMRAASAASLIGRSAKQQNDVLLLQTLGPPLANPLIKWPPLYRKIFLDFEFDNPEEFIVPMDPQAMLQGAINSMQPTPDRKEDKPGSVSKPNPDIMDQMIAPQQRGGGTGG